MIPMDYIDMGVMGKTSIDEFSGGRRFLSHYNAYQFDIKNKDFNFHVVVKELERKRRLLDFCYSIIWCPEKDVWKIQFDRRFSENSPHFKNTSRSE